MLSTPPLRAAPLGGELGDLLVLGDALADELADQRRRRRFHGLEAERRMTFASLSDSKISPFSSSSRSFPLKLSP